MYKTIERIAQAMQLPFEIGTYSKLNVQLDKVRRAGSLPACIYVESNTGSVALTPRTSELLHTQNITFGFVNAVAINEEPRSAVDKADTLVGYGMTVIGQLVQQGYNVERASYQVMYDRFDATLIFVVFTMDVTPQEGTCIDTL